MFKTLFYKALGKSRFHSSDYWEKRYATGGNSGDGSYGRLAIFKAEVINEFLRVEKIQTAVELGCGDGHQLSLIHYPDYTGLDISSSIIAACRQKFNGDTRKRFFVYQPGIIQRMEVKRAELALSLDVLYHLVERKVYEQYLIDLFGLSNKYVLIYSTNFNRAEATHVEHRCFTDDVRRMFPGWKLVKEIKNQYPGTGEQESLADFFLFQKAGS